MQLAIGNKNYSSWSMRPWVLMRELGMAFEEINIRFDSFDADSQFKQQLTHLGAATGKVPLLIDDSAKHNGRSLLVYDSLAITERLFEHNAKVWPSDTAMRALARSACAEMHSSFGQLRSLCPMNIEADLADQGALLWRDNAGLRADVARLERLWADLMGTGKGPMLCGAFSAVDAFFAFVVMRINSYALPVSKTAQAYCERVTQLSSVQAWIDGALGEQDFLDFEEPYRFKP